MVYSGSNSADLNDAITDFTITSESSGVLNFNSGGSSFTLNTGDYVVFQHGAVYNVFGDTTFDLDFAEVLTREQALALGTVSVKSAGIATVPVLLLNTPVVVAVDITPAMPDTGFTPNVDLFGSTDLSSITINSVTVVDVNTVNVSVQTSQATFAGLQLLVTAV